jgi:hypothetical protein
MTLAHFIRTIVRSAPILKGAALTVMASLGGLVLLVRAGQNISPDGQSIDMFFAYALFAAAAYLGVRAAWAALRLWAESRPPSLPANDHPFGQGGFEDTTDATRRMRSDKL